MKNILLFATIIALTTGLVSCKVAKPEQTIANLKIAITNEHNASAKYAEFSKRATEDNLMNISKLFAATSAAKAIHAKNHIAVLHQLGDSVQVVIETVMTDSTLANLNKAMKDADYENSDIYPPMAETAKGEKVPEAVNTFTWAVNVERTHMKLFEDAIAILTTDGNDTNISAIWYVCTKCGETVDSIDDIEACAICGTPSSNFETK